MFSRKLFKAVRLRNGHAASLRVKIGYFEALFRFLKNFESSQLHHAERHLDFHGKNQDSNHVTGFRISMEQCQLTCEHHEGCKAWNYRLSDDHTVGHCEMLSSVLGAFQCYTGKCISSLRPQRSTVKKLTTEKTKQKSKKSCGKRYRFFCWKHPNWNSSRKLNFLTQVIFVDLYRKLF